MLLSHCTGSSVMLAYEGLLNHFSWYSKISSSTGPVKKIGSDTPASANVMPARSMIDPGRRPDKVPMSTPPSSHSVAAPAARPRLTGNACPISVPTAVFCWNE